eukprot:2459591-Alexandrium_andersonii.AAC.1
MRDRLVVLSPPESSPALPATGSLHAASLALRDLGIDGAAEASRQLALWLEQHVSARDPLALP